MEAKFSEIVQTGSGSHPASCAMGVAFLSPGVKRAGRGVDLPPLSRAEIKEKVELYLNSLLWAFYVLNITLLKGFIQAV